MNAQAVKGVEFGSNLMMLVDLFYIILFKMQIVFFLEN